MDNQDIYEGLLSSDFVIYMKSILAILKLLKAKKFKEFSNPNYIILLISENANLLIKNKTLIYRCLYYLTNIDENPKHKDVWEVIQSDIYLVFTYGSIPAHSFKIVCKIISNFLMEADEDALNDFMVNNIQSVLTKFEENKEEVESLEYNDELNDSCYICQGCLRIFSALSNQYDNISKKDPLFVREKFIPPFLEALNFQNKYMKITTIKYIYYIINWSPNDVITFLCGDEFLNFFFPLVTNDDKPKNCLSFYSTLILKSISKLHDQDVIEKLHNFNPFDVDFSELPNHSRLFYLGFLFNIAQTDQRYADEFIQSNSLLSIINKDANEICYIVSIEGINDEKFVKYITCIYKNYPSTRIFIFNLLLNTNPMYFFVSYLIEQTETEKISIGIDCIDDLIQRITEKSEIGEILKEKILEKGNDILEDLQSFISDYTDYINTHITENMDAYTSTMNSLEMLNDKINRIISEINTIA